VRTWNVASAALVVGLVIGLTIATSLPAGAQCLVAQRDASTLVFVAGEFSFYQTSTQLDYLVLDVNGRSVYIVCSTNDLTGCDELNAGDHVMLYGHLEEASVCDDGNELHPYNKIYPNLVYLCDPFIGLCDNLADAGVCAP
jgi:hypothetical protein